MHLGETLLPWKSKDKKCCLYETPYVAAPIWVLGDVNAKFYAQRATSYRRTYKSQNSFGSRVMSFSRDPSCHFETPTWNFYEEIYQRKWYRKGPLIALLEESRKEYLQVSLQADSALTHLHEKKPQEAWRTRRPQEWDVEQSAPTHARHTHCASRQLGTTANQRYAVHWDWLREACQMARVHWGTCSKGFHSKEGPHYRIDQSARNQLECDQVWRAPEKLSRSCRQTSNNQPLFTSLEIPLGFLAQAVLHWLSGGLCHAQKCQFKNITQEEKVWFAIAQRTLAWETLAKGGTGKECRYKFLYQVPTSVLLLRKHVMCARNMGAHVRRGIWSAKGIKTGWKSDSRAAEKGAKKLVRSDFVKILEKECSN